MWNFQNFWMVYNEWVLGLHFFQLFSLCIPLFHTSLFHAFSLFPISSPCLSPFLSIPPSLSWFSLLFLYLHNPRRMEKIFFSVVADMQIGNPMKRCKRPLGMSEDPLYTYRRRNYTWNKMDHFNKCIQSVFLIHLFLWRSV